ncbi:ABC transporter substrate-binding protein [Paenibacillus xerothermodurans]|uniref:ABC transporter substrate-binding protein n=1 Tax=Paenibacillus xerothermodurans TaxID=1977292 RepID=A0A2W1N910_PAEXE|nr:ABC transporter substrate-binding protein [Paenibacillus xerothermodurans]PZE21119.1 ABC transporter substrate-binding protein [Paenibacillus xerothermodurans]
MRTARRVTALTLTAAMAAGLLSGCGGTTAGTDGKTQITLASWGSTPDETQLLKQVLQDFEHAHPDIKVKHEVIAEQYMDVMKTRLIGGKGPDVFYLDAIEAPGLMETGVLEPLDSYVTQEFDTGDFEKPMLEAFRWEGRTYGFPKGYSTLALIYNKKMLQEAGVAVPQTWEELRAASKKLTNSAAGDTVYGFGQNPELARTYYIGQSLGGQVVKDGRANFTDPAVLQGLQLYVDQHLIDKTAAQPSDVGAGWTGEMLGQGKAAMVIEGNWAIPFLRSTFPDIDFGTAEVPTINGKKGTMAFTVGYVINAASKEKQASWKLISYLTGRKGMTDWTSKGFELPTRKSVAKALGYDKDTLLGPLVAGAPYATVWAEGPTLPTIFNNFNNQFVSAYIGQRPLKEAMQDAQEQANEEIEFQLFDE